MSKRNSLPSSNTLFNYFSKTPPSNKKAKANNDEESSLQSSVSENKFESKKRERESTPSPDNKNNNENCEKESPIASKKRKRIRINPIDSDDSDVENKGTAIDNKIEVSKISTEKRLQDSFTYEPSDPSKSTKGKVVSRPSVPAKKPEAPEPQSVADEGNWVHCRLDWLKPDKVRDARRRRPDDPDYDPTTLHVPEEFLKTQTPGDFAHSGFPESAYARMASTLVSKGYKVARVEQTETPEMMQDRCKRGAEVCGLQDNGPSEANSPFMLTIAEEFHIGQFEDDKHSSRLLTTLAHFPPALIIYDRKCTSARTSKLLSTHCHSARREARNLMPAEKLLKLLAEKYYKTNEFKALGGCVTFLTECLLDIQIMAMAQFTQFTPPDVLNSTMTVDESKWTGGNSMVLDNITLRNLRIVQDEGCLLLYQWVCSPSCNISVIKQRQEAVKALFDNQELSQEAKNILTTLPDLERLLAKVHSLGNLKKSKNHPDSRAILYEEKTYSKRKVLDFISVLNGFTAAIKLNEMFADADSINYIGTEKKRYQLEIPQSAASKAGSEYHFESARKGRRIFEKFSSHHAQWTAAVQCISTLDVLLSLANFATMQTGDICLPEISTDLTVQACMVETDDSAVDNDDVPEETITFLYKLSPGACPKSYGFNAARLAGIPGDIIKRGLKVASDLEREATVARTFKELMKADKATEIRSLLAALNI
ncbi:unnamed protein product [Leptidea sinapis]|uniref:DNA mismatch repair protein MutS core domain-containing protein n=1 Tax=Leptidea sinapis TaxID=189913 RepID=A0A5E4R2P0_9NEOP|nr:unnamed protein product [Leptidea sinapis]